LVFLVVSFPLVFPPITYMHFFFLPNPATCLANLILLDFIVLIILGEEYKSRSSSLCSFLHLPVTSSLFGQNILLSTLFSNILSLCSFLSDRDQVSHPYKTTGKLIVLNILILDFLAINNDLLNLKFHGGIYIYEYRKVIRAL
jgi:hypothetical protein